MLRCQSELRRKKLGKLMLCMGSWVPVLNILFKIAGTSNTSMYVAASIATVSRLYWYRGGTVLLPGWVIWKYMWFVHANLPIGRLTSVRTVDLHWGEWLNSSADFNPNHNDVNAAPSQASLQTTSRPHHHATPKQNYCIPINVLVSIPICEI